MDNRFGRIGPPGPDETILWVGNLRFDTTEEDVDKVFRERGLTPSIVKIARNRQRDSRGFGFVMIHNSQVNKALSAMYGAKIGDRGVRVSLSTSPQCFA